MVKTEKTPQQGHGPDAGNEETDKIFTEDRLFFLRFFNGNSLRLDREYLENCWYFAT